MGLVMYLRCRDIISIWQCFAYCRYFMLSKNEPSLLHCSVCSGPHFIILLVVILWNLDIKWEISNILWGELVYIVNLFDKAPDHASNNWMGLWPISVTGSFIKFLKINGKFRFPSPQAVPGDRFKNYLMHDRGLYRQGVLRTNRTWKWTPYFSSSKITILDKYQSCSLK